MPAPIPDLCHRFETLYSQWWGSLPAETEEERAPWFDLLSRVGPHEVETLVRRVQEDRGGLRGRPHLGEFWRAYHALHGGSDVRTTWVPLDQRCRLCGSSGWMSFVGRRSKTRPYTYEIVTTQGPETYWWVVPCRCSDGQAILRSTQAYDVDLQTRVFEYLTRDKTDDPLITWDQFTRDNPDLAKGVGPVLDGIREFPEEAF